MSTRIRDSPVLLHCRLPAVAVSLHPEPLSEEEHRIVEWLRTGLVPLSESIEDPLPSPHLSRRRLSTDITPRTIRPDERKDDWWSDAYLWGPFRRFTPDHPRITWFLYTLQPGAKLYHGTQGDVTHDMVLSRPNFFGDWTLATTFFAQSFHEHHENGGVVLQFVVIKPLLLLAVDHTETVRTLNSVWQRNGMNAEFIRRLRVAFPWALDDTSTEHTRRFGSGNDVPLFQKICTSFAGIPRGIDGTASRFMTMARGCMSIHQSGALLLTMDVMSPGMPDEPPVRSDANKDVPPELFLCDPRSALMKCEHVWAAPWEHDNTPKKGLERNRTTHI